MNQPNDYDKYEVRHYRNGDIEWWRDNRLHREDGPAVIRYDGTKEWYLNGYQYSRNQLSEFNKELMRLYSEEKKSS